MKVTPISSMRPRNRCPDCSTSRLACSSLRDGRDSDGITLWDLKQACIMCGWENATPSVKVGV